MIGLYQAGDSRLHRLHPLTKLTLAFGLIVVALAVAIDWLPLALFLVVLLPLSAVAQVARPFLVTTTKLLLPLAVSLFLIQSLVFPEGSTVIARLGPLAVKAEGLRFAFATAMRILLITAALLLVLLTTHPGRMMTGLMQKGLPPGLAYVIVTTLQIVPQMRDRAQIIVDAQRARGLETEGSPWARLQALVALAGPLVLGALLDVEERSVALEARAFGAHGPRTSLVEIVDRPWERYLRWSVLVVIVVVLAGQLWQGLR